MIHASPSGRGWSARRPSACARNTTQHYCSRRRLLEPRCHSLSNNNKMHWAGYTPTVGRTSHIARAGQTHETRHTRRRHDSQRTDMIAATHTHSEKNRVREGDTLPRSPSCPVHSLPPTPPSKEKARLSLPLLRHAKFRPRTPENYQAPEREREQHHHNTHAHTTLFCTQTQRPCPFMFLAYFPFHCFALRFPNPFHFIFCFLLQVLALYMARPPPELVMILFYQTTLMNTPPFRRHCRF